MFKALALFCCCVIAEDHLRTLPLVVRAPYGTSSHLLCTSYRAHRSRRSSSSDDSSRSSSPDQRGRANRSGQSSKVESRSSTPESQVKTVRLVHPHLRVGLPLSHCICNSVTDICHTRTLTFIICHSDMCHLSPCHFVTQLGLARNQAIITAMLNKTDEKYKAAEGESRVSHDCHMTLRRPSCTPARNKPQAAPVSSVLASLESDEFVPQPFVSHRTARTGSGEVCT